MKNGNIFNEAAGYIFGTDSGMDESGICESHGKHNILIGEMKKFMFHFNQSKTCNSIQSKIHLLYISLLHLDNVEVELITSGLPEEMLHQTNVIEDIRSLKRMVLKYIRDLSEELNN